MTNIERRTITTKFVADWQGTGDEKQEIDISLDWYAVKHSRYRFIREGRQ